MHLRRAVVLGALVLPGLLSLTAGGVLAIVTTGNWAVTISASDLIGGAGTDLQGSYESPADQVSVSISGSLGPSDTWRVDVRRSDTTWHDDVHLWLQRTGDGTGGSVAGGTSYLEVTATDAAFFTGSDDVSGIPVQLELTGMSIAVPPASYSTTVVFTIVDT
ncbi:MAG: hypothetical protein WBC63_05660 [Candidatus Bipolaricaulia bacterium]